MGLDDILRDIGQLSSLLLAEPDEGPISLDKLEKWINDIDKQFPQDIQLKGISYDRASNKSFGFKSDGSDFAIIAPSALIKSPTPHLEIRNEKMTKMTPSQKAFIEVTKKGLEAIPAGSDTILMDWSTLFPRNVYFGATNDSDGSVLQGIDKELQAENVKNKKVIIRIIAGDQNAPWSDVEKECNSIFFTTQNGQKVPTLNHPNLELYVGLYSPDFNPKEKEDVQEVKAFIEKIMSSPIFKSAELKNMMKGASFNQVTDNVMKQDSLKALPSISWNHGKILAVNGQTLMTGGINYYDEYTSGSEHDIADTSVKIQGDAAVSAHRWADYFWKYLAKPSATDQHSACRFMNLSAGRSTYTWEAVTPTTVPDSKKILKTVQGKTLETLTISRLGDWHGSMKRIQYPIQLIDSLKDMILNLAWVTMNPTGAGAAGAMFLALVAYLSDDNLTTAGDLPGLGLNPMAWASRYARIQAIRSAKDSVIISQQMLTQCLGDGIPEYRATVYQANLKITKKEPAPEFKEPFNKVPWNSIPWNTPWEGHTWPYDLLVALARALGHISKSTTPDLYATEKRYRKESKGIFFVLTTDNQNGSHNDGWQDVMKIHEFKRRLKIVMQNLPKHYGGIDAHKIDDAIKNFVHFKRTSTTKTAKGHDLYNHSKIVVVDRRVMYVGSDNAYPSYNEEHGVWIDDQKTIDGYLGGFLEDFWNICEEPTESDLTA